VSLERVTSALPETRRFVDRHLRTHVSRETADDVKVVVSELVSNALLHGAGGIRLNLCLLDDAVRVEVADEGDAGLPHIDEQPDETGGWGLRLVEAIALRWGVYEGSTHVWADVPR
jgi:anti-sigma regulatory factor (Ser/Thr protein kinase)